MHELVEVVVVSHRDIWVSRTPEWRNPIPRAPCILSEEESTSGVGRREERRSAATVYLPRREIECAKQGSWGQSASQFSEPGSPHFPLHNGSNIELGPEIELGRRESIILYTLRELHRAYTIFGHLLYAFSCRLLMVFPLTTYRNREGREGHSFFFCFWQILVLVLVQFFFWTIKNNFRTIIHTVLIRLKRRIGWRRCVTSWLLKKNRCS